MIRSILAFLLVGAPFFTQAAITATVFRDFNGNGVQDTGEPGVQGAAVRFDNGATTGTSAATIAVGTVSIATGTGTSRLELVTPGTALFSTGNTAGGVSNVQFVADGGTVSFPISNPAQFCAAAPDATATNNNDTAARILTNQFIHAPMSPGAVDSTVRSIMNFNFDVNTLANANNAGAAATTNATYGQVGSTMGLAVHRRGNFSLSGAWLRRHTELGRGGVGGQVGGTGTIYATNLTTNASCVFADINDIAGSLVAGADPRPKPGDAAYGNYDLVHDAPGNTTANAAALFSNVGKLGLGDIDFSEDERSLYAINLAAKTLVRMDASVLASNPTCSSVTAAPLISTVLSTTSIPVDACVGGAGNARPGAIGLYDGKVYVGVTCTAESTASTSTRGTPADLKAVVYRFDPATNTFIDGAVGGAAIDPVFSTSLNYTRGCQNPTAQADDLPLSLRNPAGTCVAANWNPWQPNYDVVFNYDTTPGNPSASTYYIEYAQPFLTDIGFAGDGDLILGVRDITGDRVGFCRRSPDVTRGAAGNVWTQVSGSNFFCSGTPATDAANNTTTGGIARGNGEGDLLCANNTGTDSWAIEADGLCGTDKTSNNTSQSVASTTTVAAPNGASPTGVAASGAFPENGQGFDGADTDVTGGEFYWNDQGPGGENGVAGNAHGETVGGGFAVFYGRNDQLVTTMIDPTAFYDAGALWLSNINGGSTKRSQIFDSSAAALTAAQAAFGGKSNGLGDVESICDPQPIRIGNRLFNDADSDGVQDPGEAGLANITVRLYDAAGNLRGQVATDASGNYQFTLLQSASNAAALTPSATATATANLTAASIYGQQFFVYLPGTSTAGVGSGAVPTGPGTGNIPTTARITLVNAISGVGSDDRDSEGVTVDPDGASALALAGGDSKPSWAK
jgi:hypothetical protein